MRRKKKGIFSLTGSIPETKIHGGSVADHVGAEVIEHSGYVILQRFSKIQEYSKNCKEPQKKRGEEEEVNRYSGELVTGVANQHTGLAHGSIPDGDALDEPRSAHLSRAPRKKGTRGKERGRESE